MILFSDAAFRRVIADKCDPLIDARDAALKQAAIAEVNLQQERDRSRRIVAKLRDFERRFHQLEYAAMQHDLVIEERPEIPAKPATLVLKRLKSTK